MAWHLPYRPTQLHYAVSAAMLCAIGAAIALPTAKAATLGKTTVTSAQHEPLVAIISVSNIEGTDFSASLASPVLYQQLGLTPTAFMSVNFVPTSATTGQLMISTSQPISKPFADIVLTINNQGKRNIIPKTLLMPLSDSMPVESQNRIIATAIKPNLPVISANNTRPLALRRGAPPPLFEQKLPQIAVANTFNEPKLTASKMMPVISVATIPNLPMTQMAITQTTTTPLINNNISELTASNVASIANTKTLTIETNNRVNSRVNGGRSNKSSANTITNSVDAVQSTTPTSNAAIKEILTQTASPTVAASSATNVQQNLLTQSKTENSALEDNSASTNKAANATALNDTLNIEVTRQITVRNSPINKVNSTDSPTLALKFDESIASLNPTKDAPLNTQATNSPAAGMVAEEQAEDLQSALDANATTNADATNTKTANIEADSNVVQTDKVPLINYTVQRNDNLWVISKPIAEQNNLDIATVMRQIQAQNPNAFINQDADQLKDNAQLSLSNYAVVPSQSSLQTAIAAQRERFLRTQKVQDKTSDKAKATSADALDLSVNESVSVSVIAKNAEKKPK